MIFLVLMLVVFYFIPTFVALMSENRNLLPIFILNLFFGWTIIGWVGALIWATLREKKESSRHLQKS